MRACVCVCVCVCVWVSVCLCVGWGLIITLTCCPQSPWVSEYHPPTDGGQLIIIYSHTHTPLNNILLIITTPACTCSGSYRTKVAVICSMVYKWIFINWGRIQIQYFSGKFQVLIVELQGICVIVIDIPIHSKNILGFMYLYLFRVILWNITINCFLFYYLLKCNLFLWWQSKNFGSH